jgi:two-component system response regulator RpfG
MANVMLLGPDRRRTGDIRSLLRQDGHDVTYVPEVFDWRAREREILPELVIAAVDSIQDVLTGRRSRRRRGFPAPLLFVEQTSEGLGQPELDDRLVDCITTPFMHEELLARIDALVRVRRVIRHIPTTPADGNVEDRAEENAPGRMRRAGRRVAALLRTRVPRYERPVDPYLEVAARVARWADRRDAYQPGHAERVTSLCAMIAESLDIAESETAALLRAAMLHDIGKVALPVEMLHQKSPLEESQMRMIRTHPKRGAALIHALERDDEVAEAILCHHERPDGFGYYGLDEESIPRPARVLAVAEVFDGMTTTRLTSPLSNGKAMDRLDSFKGVSLDADCVDALVDRLKPLPRSVALSPRSPGHTSRS